MLNLILLFYILVAFFLIVFILLDKGKGSEIGALNSGNEIFSARISNSFFNKLIIILAILLLVANFSIGFLSKNNSILNKPIVNVSYDEK